MGRPLRRVLVLRCLASRRDNHFRDAREDREHHEAGRSRRVSPGLAKGSQAGLRLVELFGNLQQIARRPHQPVEP